MQHLLRVAGRETQRAAAVDDQLAQSEGDVADPLFGRLVAYGVVVDRPSHARERGEEEPVLLRAAHLLDHDGHLLLGDQVLRRLHVGLRRREIDRGVDALDRLLQQTQLAVFVPLRIGNHIGRIDAGEGLVVRIFQLRRRPHRQRPAHRAHVGFQRLAQLVGKRRTDELRENLLVGHLGGEHVFQPVVADEGVEIVGRHHHRAGNRHADVLVFGVLAVFHQHAVHEGQPARLAAE